MRRASRFACVMLAICTGGLATAPVWAQQRLTPIVAPGGTDADKAKLTELRTAALGEDRQAAMKALTEMKELKAIGRPTLVDSLRAILMRDRATVEAAVKKAAIPTNNLAAVESEAATLRKTALDQINAMSDPASVKPVRVSYQKLRGVAIRLSDAYDTRWTMIQAMRHRPALAAMWNEVDPKVGLKVIDPPAETKLLASVEAALGPKLAPLLKDLQARPDDKADPNGSTPEQQALLDWRMRRRVEAYNQTLASKSDPAEFELVRMINTYREALGLPALELDLRLQQAARRHSKEMVEQKYFSSASPNENTKDAGMRMKAAGFDAAVAWSEALARNTKTATETFWFLFDVPPYHQAMTSPKLTVVGIGRWGSYWAVDYAEGKRLMLATDDERSSAQVQGTIVEPQVAARTERAGGGSGNDDSRPTDPTKIRPTIPGGGTPTIPAIPGLGGF